MYCDTCGKEIKEHVVYCKFCGTKVNESGIDKLENYGLDVGGAFFSLGDLGGSEEDRANYYFKRGVEKSNEQEFYEAIEYFEKALSCNSKITNCYGNIAGLYQRLKHYDKAILWYNKGFSIIPNDILMLTNFAILFYEIDDFDEALRVNSILMSLEPDNPEHKERKLVFEQVKNGGQS